jgi:hypothetical protein
LELRIERVPVEMVRLKLLILVKAVHRLAELVKLPKRFPDRGLRVCL